MRTQARRHTYIITHARTCVHMCVCPYVCICLSICLSVWMYVCLPVCMYVLRTYVRPHARTHVRTYVCVYWYTISYVYEYSNTIEFTKYDISIGHRQQHRTLKPSPVDANLTLLTSIFSTSSQRFVHACSFLAVCVKLILFGNKKTKTKHMLIWVFANGF